MIKLEKYVRLATITLFFVMALLSGYFLFTSPVAFQKFSMIKFVEPFELTLAKPERWIDVKGIIKNIPYKQNVEMIYEVEPKQKYQKTIKQGYGNCSNLAFGLAYYLGRHNYKYQIIHLLPPEGFLMGQGHTVINAPYVINGKKHYGIIDILEGGLPTNNGVFIDLNSLRNGGFTNPSILSLNPNKDNTSPYYGEFLNRSVIGVLAHNEIKSYFDFVESIYIPLGNKKLEKIFYDGLSIIFGYYPYAYVNASDYETLLKRHKSARFLAVILLTSMRIFLVFLGLLIAMHVFSMVKYCIAKRRA